MGRAILYTYIYKFLFMEKASQGLFRFFLPAELGHTKRRHFDSIDKQESNWTAAIPLVWLPVPTVPMSSVFSSLIMIFLVLSLIPGWDSESTESLS